MAISNCQLAKYSLETTFEDLSPRVIEQTKWLILDSLACCIGAYSSEPSKNLRRCYRGKAGGDTRATIFGEDRSIDVEYSSLINSFLCRYLDFNDCYTGSFGGGHPSDHIPALISIAEAENRSGRELIEAIVVAYEIQCRGIDTGAIYRRGFDYQSVWGAFSAPAAVGKLLDLSESEMANAIGISGTANNPLAKARRGEVTMWKGLSMPYVIHNAVQACYMAESGITGPDPVFEGVGGVFEVVTGGEISLDLDGHEKILETNFKPYAGCYHALPALTGVIEIMADGSISPTNIDAIDIETYEISYISCAGPEKWSTKLTRETADHSLPYMTAVAILDSDLLPEHFSETWLGNEAVHRLMDRTTVRESERLNHLRENERGLMPTRVTVETNNELYESFIEYPYGHFNNPISKPDLLEKAEILTTSHLNDSQLEELIHVCENIESVADVHDIPAAMVI